MKIRLLSTFISLVIAIGGLNFSVLNAASHESHGDEEHTELGGKMEEISKAFRRLRRQVKDPSKNALSAELAAKMLENAKAALQLEPVWTMDKPKAEQADFVAGFKKEMKVLVGLLEDLHAAFEAGENEKAVAVVSKLRDHQKKGHKAYKKPDED